MGKASSSKKVRAAARTGGARRSSGRSGPNLVWPVSIGAIVVLGVLLISLSRGGGDDLSVPPRIGGQDHWHAAYGVWGCDRWLPPVQDQTDPAGIHSHGDGVIHVHPFSARSAGENAVLARFTEAIDGFDLSDDRVSVPGVGEFEEGETDCDGEGATLRALVWDDARNDEEPSRVVTDNLADIRLTDGSAIAIVFAPEGEDVPKPPTVPQLDNLTDVPQSQQGGTTPTAPTAPTAPTDTSGEGTDDTTATTAEGTETTATTEAP